MGDWATAYAKARAFVSQLTLEEKVNLTTGTGWEVDKCVGQTGSIPRLGFRAMCLQDSPVGVRDSDFNSVFPAGVNVAATWDRDLAFARGKAMGEEHKGKGSDMQLGPVAGPLGRVPEGGRNWEGFSPDPVLTGQMFAESIKGIQSAGIMTSAKHYIAYEQEHFRLVSDAVGYGFNITEPGTANLDDVTMHEIYLWPFAGTPLPFSSLAHPTSPSCLLDCQGTRTNRLSQMASRPVQPRLCVPTTRSTTARLARTPTLSTTC